MIAWPKFKKNDAEVMRKTSKTFVHTFIYMAGLIANRGVAFLLIPFYTRALVPGQFAKLDLCTTTVIFLLPLFELAMGSALVRFYHYTEDAQGRKDIVASSFTFVTLSIVFFSSLGVLFAEPIGQAIFGGADNKNLIYLIVVTIAVTALGNQVLALLRAQDKSVHFALLNLVRALVGPGVIIYLVIQRDMGIAGVLLGDIVGLSAMLLIGLGISRQWVTFRIRWDDLRVMLPFALPLAPWALSTSIITMSDRYLLRAWVGYDELAVYSLGFKIGMVMTLFTRAFQTAWPSSAYQIAKEEDSSETFLSLFDNIALASIFLAFLLSVASPVGIPIMSGREAYALSHLYVPLIALSYAIYMLVLYVLTALTIHNNTKFVLFVVAFSCCTKILLSLLLIYYVGAIGAAIATLMTFILELYVSCYIVNRLYKLRYNYHRFMLLLGTSLLLVYAYYFLAHGYLAAQIIGAPLVLLAFFGVIHWMGYLRWEAILHQLQALRNRD